MRKGRFFNVAKLDELGDIHLNRLHTPYWSGGIDWDVAYEVALGEDVKRSEKGFVYVNHPVRIKGFEFYRDKEGYSPLFVMRDLQGKVLYGAYAPLQSIKQDDGTYIYRSGSAKEAGSFDFPHDPGLPTVFKLQTEFYPDKEKKKAGEVSIEAWRFDPSPWLDPKELELFKGKSELGDRVRVGDYLLSMDEVRYWASTKVIYRPGLGLIFFSFWLALGGIALSLFLKMTKVGAKEEV